jgi:hypothetical protein
LDSRMRYNCLEYLVKWKGYDESHNQWEVHTQIHTKPKIAQLNIICKGNPNSLSEQLSLKI